LALRNRRIENGSEPVRRLRFPVVSVGSLSAGGAGKTPLTIALAKALTRRGLTVDVLSRGFGRQSRLPARVDPNGTAEVFGDEPLLITLETVVPVYVATQRYEAGLLAEAEQSLTVREKGQTASGLADSEPVGWGFSPGIKPTETPGALAPEICIHLLDDGFQHRQLYRDVNILLLDQRDWCDGLLPAGNLREPLQAARRATVMAIPADNPEFEAALRAWGWQGPLWRLYRKMEVPAPPGHEAGSVLAFCGIARPEQFFAGLEATGLRIASRLAFPDHHCYSANDLKHLVAVARSASATALITTEKDQVRLGKLSALLRESLPLKTARLRVEIEKQEEALDWLVERIGQPATVNTSGRLLRK
jgi:tetraacyldisaccharide 4'-kinase